MLFKSIIAATAMAGVAMSQSEQLSIATPTSLVQCQPYLIRITGGQAPFIVQATEAGNINNIIEQIATGLNDRTSTWIVNIPSGTSITLNVVDATGANQASAQSNPINSSSDSSCLNKSASVSGGGGGATTGGSGSSSQSNTGSSGPSSTRSTPTSGSNGGSTSAPTSSNTSAPGGGNGAAQLSGFSAAIAGAVGVAVAALL